MKKVAVIYEYKVVAVGNNDGKIVDSYYTRVDGELYFAASLIRAEDADLVSKLMSEQQAIINEANTRLFEIRTVFNNILTSGLDSTDYPSIRSKEWFKAIKPKI